MTGVGAIRLGDGVTASATMDCPMDGPLFRADVAEVLVPVLRAGDVVVMDNLTAHKRPLIQRQIESAGARVL